MGSWWRANIFIANGANFLVVFGPDVTGISRRKLGR